ncbi:hypothetical protein F0365_06175 [Nonlabens sp. Ci31]|uniref:hypothetical protein n=1 Tax=Nonlabens sp. Ci31 TaxID=2608253 RepID=UPI0014644576|nr:hypothetical protein [Nonlabens sp. Ci31]QJP34020.1 hypothetical protein F0365_06175 [Nonlabens sp. Ci31]
MSVGLFKVLKNAWVVSETVTNGLTSLPSLGSTGITRSSDKLPPDELRVPESSITPSESPPLQALSPASS